VERVAPGSIAVIFVAARTAADEVGYQAAAARMAARATAMPGYLGMDSARGADGVGVTVSWWTDRAAARAWRDDPEHAAIRERGRTTWYRWYRLTVAEVERGYEWERD
jgi:heme-degrading monooxygenase HmoA